MAINLFRKDWFLPIEKLEGLLTAAISGLCDLVFPPRPFCPACGREFQPVYPRLGFCRACLERFPLLVPPLCPRCGRSWQDEEAVTGRTIAAKAAGGDPAISCRYCRGEKRHYQRMRAVAVYDGYMREILQAVKYGFRPDLAAAVGSLLAVAVENDPAYDRIDAVIPVPLHPERLAARGYNQGLFLAEPVAAALRVPILTETLVRKRFTKSQSGLGRHERKTNVAGAFLVTNCWEVAGKRLLLVDDICTTGYTLSECARVLLLAGARRVECLTAALGVLEEIGLKSER
jgi:ComF family protein